MAELDGADAEVISRAGAITCIDFVDQLRFHRYGLLPDVASERHDWAGLVFQEFIPDIEEALGKLEPDVAMEIGARVEA